MSSLSIFKNASAFVVGVCLGAFINRRWSIDTRIATLFRMWRGRTLAPLAPLAPPTPPASLGPHIANKHTVEGYYHAFGNIPAITPEYMKTRSAYKMRERSERARTRQVNRMNRMYRAFVCRILHTHCVYNTMVKVRALGPAISSFVH